jgi:hypothetical protein
VEGDFGADDEMHLALRPFFRCIYDSCGADYLPWQDDALKAMLKRVTG